MNPFLNGVIVSVAVAAVWACAAGTPEAETATAETPSADNATTAAPVVIPERWQPEMTTEQQIAYMKEKVMPAMTPVFQSYDAKEFEKFGCETCHGPDYKTPTEYLPALTMKDGKLLAFEDDPEIAKMMAEKVVPAMATALGMEPYNPETQQGFGCGGCHSIEQD